MTESVHRETHPFGAGYRTVVYFDDKPCAVCGAPVRLRARQPHDVDEPSGPVGPADGVVGGGDPTVDQRVRTNEECPTNAATDGSAPTP